MIFFDILCFLILFVKFQGKKQNILTTVRIILVRFKPSGQMPVAIAKTAHVLFLYAATPSCAFVAQNAAACRLSEPHRCSIKN